MSESDLGPITPREAEYVAAAIMRDHLGFKDAAVTTASGDGGVDVVAKQSVAQVKHWGSQVGRPAIQQLYGARGADHSKKMVFFCSGGYSRQALAYADEVRVALFTFDAAGSYEAVNESAKEIDFTAKEQADKARKQADRKVRRAQWDAGIAEAKIEHEAKQVERRARVKAGDIPLFTGRTGLAIVVAVAGLVWTFVVLEDTWLVRGIAIVIVCTVVISLLVAERRRLNSDWLLYVSKSGN